MLSLYFMQVDYPEIAEGVVPRHRFMSAYEQKVRHSICIFLWKNLNGFSARWLIVN
jgi:hypothetical protein